MNRATLKIDPLRRLGRIDRRFYGNFIEHLGRGLYGGIYEPGSPLSEGDKVAAQLAFGYAVNGYGMGDLVREVHAVGDAEIDRLTGEYAERYVLADTLRPGGAQHAALREAARIELGLRAF
jgi:L-arabinose isomerase